MDTFRQTVQQQAAQERKTAELTAGVVSGAAVSLSVGYVLWIIRGGYLLSSLLSSMPAWRFIDPLPILDNLDGEPAKGKKDDEDDDESLQSLLEKQPPQRVTVVRNDRKAA